MVNAKRSVKIRQLTHTQSPFCFVVGVIMETEQLLVHADPAPLSTHTLKHMALQRNGRRLGCPHAKSCAVPKGSVFCKYVLRMHELYTVEALLIKAVSLAKEIFGSAVFIEVCRR